MTGSRPRIRPAGQRRLRGLAAAAVAATSPAAHVVVFTSSGHAVPRITIPAAAGSSLSTGPPHQDRILLTGLRRRLRTGQTVTISLVFAMAGHATLRVPVIEPTP